MNRRIRREVDRLQSGKGSQARLEYLVNTHLDRRNLFIYIAYHLATTTNRPRPRIVPKLLSRTPACEL
jgi:hypothetical protein